ncbi:MAG: sigma-70 family RNA polymerase sigma factor [Jatrophihabitans sp.]|uniref:sigma-70 family RNA polymerase sigma factor n=1 Tax=Jatrophihabitans sp. TaxID=1932789 RepID=UPI003F80C7BB
MDAITERFEAERDRLHAVARQLLGSAADADDVVQEAWLRLHRTDAGEIDNLSAWLTTVVSRLCLDQLRRRAARREDPLDEAPPRADDTGPDPEREALLGDAVGPALVVLLDSLRPVERLSFVLHDVFAVPFDEIAEIVGRSPDAVRQLTSRARRRVQGRRPDGSIDVARQQRVVKAFLEASRHGRFDDLLAVLAPDVVVRADAVAAAMGAEVEIRTAQAVATAYNGRAKALRLALLDGVPGGVWAVAGEVKVAFEFTVVDDRITELVLVADPERLATLEVDYL